MDAEAVVALVFAAAVLIPILIFSLSNGIKDVSGIPREREELGKREDEYEKKNEELQKKENALALRENEYNKKIEDVEDYVKKVLARVDKYVDAKCESYPYLAGLMADFLTLHYEKSAQYLERKAHPAHAEASRIRDLKRETKEIIVQKKALEYKLAYIDRLFPNISDVFDSGFAEETFALETEEDTDRTRFFLSAEEYQVLPTAEKNQLALDRYVANRKSKWQIGRDYEMYIGHCVEKKGFAVRYTGIIEKLEDMGRDLIAKKGKNCYIIQCKNWSQEKTIHEKHIFQLYGTVILYRIDHPEENVQGVFVTSTELSSKAKTVAHMLGITILEKIALKEFPRIKCNINRTSGLKIYHLPFDQQYDSAVIEKNRGEFYAFTVADAESQGFRRAWKHFS